MTALLFHVPRLVAVDFEDKTPGLVDLPEAPPGFEVKLFARDPLVRNPCSMAFDAKGRLFVGQGPQYRNPTPETPRDSVLILLDTDGNGAADKTKVFATGFNCIQGMAWHGRDLWVGNSPDLTIARDLDGDDEADEYVLIYTDLGNIEHGIHGLNWAPDGKLYMSKGNSKGLTQAGRIAPKPFRDLWGVTSPPGAPDFPAPRTFKKGEYKNTYQDPNDDWGREGGVLRCDDLGKNLEIVARGMRNPWDITFDDTFNWLGTDNDQVSGDRIIMPFFGANFGWSHAWSSDWSGENHLPTVPVSAPLFEGSGTGLIYHDSPQFPKDYRGVFFINDWLSKKMFVYRPRWDGALLQPSGGHWEEFLRGSKALFRPTDLEVGPDGALYCLGWGTGYGVQMTNGAMINEGRVFRIAWKDAPINSGSTSSSNQRDRAMAKWTFAELLADLGAPLPVWRIDAQDELVRRGSAVKKELIGAMEKGKLNLRLQTWIAWTLARIAPEDRGIEEFFNRSISQKSSDLNLRIQSIRALAYRIKQFGRVKSLPGGVTEQLKNAEPRLRFEAVQAIAQGKQASSVGALQDLAAGEKDRVTFYAAWHALRDLASIADLKALLKDSRGGVRRAALLALLDTRALATAEVRLLTTDSDEGARQVANLWLAKTASGEETAIIRGRPLAGGPPASPASEPEVILKPLAKPTTLAQAMGKLDEGNRERGEHLFFARGGPGCFNCHAVANRGNNFGPNLSNLGDRAEPRHVVESMLAPNAVITEGFTSHAVETDDADYTGMLQEETDFVLTLVQGDGQPVRIDKKKIKMHRTLATSAMPSFAELLTPQQVADVAAWLLAQRGKPGEKAASSPIVPTTGKVSTTSTRKESRFAVAQKADRLIITDAGQPVAEYVFKDDKIPRPYFSNVRAPGGIQVTRNHPPQAADAADHDTMHPGVWMGFGDISGTDFWRNQGSIQHADFVEPPKVTNDKITFATRNRLLTREGKQLGEEISRVSLRSIPAGYLLIWEATFQSNESNLIFGDQEEMGLGVRVATSIIEKNGGLIRSSEGLETARASWGKPARWCDYSGTINGQTVGVTILTDPANFRPSWFHNRDYGVFVANPFGRKAFNQGESSSVAVKAGVPFKLRYGVLFHSAPAGVSIDIGEVYTAFVKNSMTLPVE